VTTEIRPEPRRQEPSTCHFVCSGCRTVLSIPESAFATRGYSINCEICSKPISIRPVSADSSMEVLELSGCQYAGKDFPKELPPPLDSFPFEATTELKDAVGSWIADTVKPGEAGSTDRNTDPGKGSFVEELITKWEVRRKNGEVFQFETFALIRKWIEEKKITSGDEIIPTGGTAHPVDTYPGTADLFGNVVSAAPGRQIFAASAVLSRMRHQRIQQVLVGLIILALLAAAASFPYVRKIWHKHQGESFVSGLVASSAPTDSTNPAALYSSAVELVRQGTSNSLPHASSLFLSLLATRKGDPDLLAWLGETWTEIGALTADKDEFARADTLIEYAEVLRENDTAVQRARARWLWRTGDANRAATMAGNLDPKDLDGQLLLARIAASRGDFTKATITLSEVLKREPNNLPFLLAMVDVFEKQLKLNEAASYLIRVESLAPDPEPYTAKLKGLYRKAGDLDSLEGLYHKSIAAHSKTAESDQIELIRLLYGQSRFNEAAKESLDYFAEHPEGTYSVEVRRIYADSMSGTKAAPEGHAAPQQPARRARSSRYRRD
jgi:LSD1 subclass zinc finger protein